MEAHTGVCLCVSVLLTVLHSLSHGDCPATESLQRKKRLSSLKINVKSQNES